MEKGNRSSLMKEFTRGVYKLLSPYADGRVKEGEWKDGKPVDQFAEHMKRAATGVVLSTLLRGALGL